MKTGLFLSFLAFIGLVQALDNGQKANYVQSQGQSGQFPRKSGQLSSQSGQISSQSGQLPSKSGPQSIDCYDLPNQSGEPFSTSDYVPDLAEFGFDDRISSCCFNGVWVMYADANYNKGQFDAYQLFWFGGDNQCFNLANYNFDNVATSMRYAGAPNGLKFNTLNFYEGPSFMGEEQYTYYDIGQFPRDNFGNSAIITGCSPWTIYESANYQGQSACLYPADTTWCFPGFFGDPGDLGGLAGKVSSAREGCHSERRVHARPMGAGNVTSLSPHF